MNVKEVHEFMNKERLAVLSTVTDSGQPQAALMGMAVTPQLEIIFDTVKSSRKYPNLKKNPRVAWVVGCTTEVSVQYEGLADELAGEELSKYKKIYFATFPDGPVRVSRPTLPILSRTRRGSGTAITIQTADALKCKSSRARNLRKQCKARVRAARWRQADWRHGRPEANHPQLPSQARR